MNVIVHQVFHYPPEVCCFVIILTNRIKPNIIQVIIKRYPPTGETNHDRQLIEEGFAEHQEYWKSIRTRVVDKMPGRVEKIERIQSEGYSLNKKADAAIDRGNRRLAKYYLISLMMICADLEVQMQKVRAALGIKTG